jgi:hypothetical protein
LDTDDPTLEAAYRAAMRLNPLTVTLRTGTQSLWLAEEQAFWWEKAITEPSGKGVSRALMAIAVLPFLILQKPSRAGKGTSLFSTVSRRVNQWNDGAVGGTGLLGEAMKIGERRLKERMEKADLDPRELDEVETLKKIVRLMREGEVRKAGDFLSNSSERRPVVWSEAVKRQLEKLHPRATESEEPVVSADSR